MATRIKLQDLHEELARLNALDRKACTVEDFLGPLKRLFDGYACMTRLITSQWAFGARKNPPGTRFEHASQLWHPPPAAVTRMGRVNRIGQPMFYIGASANVATLEMRPEIGDVLTILRLKRRPGSKDLSVMELGIAEKQSLHATKQTVRILENSPYRGFVEAHGGAERNIALRNFLAREFLQVVSSGNEDQFKVTIAIAEFLLGSDRIDGLVYPSLAGDVSNWAGGANLAIKPDRADALWEADACWMIRVEDYVTTPKAGHQVRCIGGTKPFHPDGSIAW